MIITLKGFAIIYPNVLICTYRSLPPKIYCAYMYCLFIGFYFKSVQSCYNLVILIIKLYQQF